MMTTNLFVIANVKQLRTGGSFRILLPFFRTSWGVGILNSAIFKSLHKQVEFGTILDGLRYFGGGGLNQLKIRPRYATSPQPPNWRTRAIFLSGNQLETCPALVVLQQAKLLLRQLGFGVHSCM